MRVWTPANYFLPPKKALMLFWLAVAALLDLADGLAAAGFEAWGFATAAGGAAAGGGAGLAPAAELAKPRSNAICNDDFT